MSVDCIDYELPDVCQSEMRRAAKQHRCGGCRETIERGELYHVTRALFDGEWDVIKRCARCEAMYRLLSHMIDRTEDPYEACDPELNCGHTFEQRWKVPAPPAVQALAFLTRAEAQRIGEMLQRESALGSPLNFWSKPEERVAELVAIAMGGST